MNTPSRRELWVRTIIAWALPITLLGVGVVLVLQSGAAQLLGGLLLLMAARFGYLVFQVERDPAYQQRIDQILRQMSGSDEGE